MLLIPFLHWNLPYYNINLYFYLFISLISWHLHSLYFFYDELVLSTIAVAISPDGETVATSHGDHTIKIFKYYSGEIEKNVLFFWELWSWWSKYWACFRFIVWSHVPSHRNVPHRITSHRNIPHSITSYRDITHHIVSQYIVTYHIICNRITGFEIGWHHRGWQIILLDRSSI